jgi:hypothetical protein
LEFAHNAKRRGKTAWDRSQNQVPRSGTNYLTEGDTIKTKQMFDLTGKIALITGVSRDITLLLAAAASDYITGQAIAVDGGCTAV